MQSADSSERLARAEGRRLARERRAGPAAAGGSLLATGWGRALAAAAAVLAAVTLAGLALLWPGEVRHGGGEAMGGPTVGATVTGTSTAPCLGPAAQTCRGITARLRGGRTTTITLGPVEVSPALTAGAHIRVQRVPAPAGASGVEPYAYAGVDRRGALLWVALAFVALVVAIARLRGVLAIAGFALSLLLVTKFVVPAILAGSSGLLVAVVGALAVMFVTVVFTYGITGPSLAACLGIGVSLLVAALGAEAVADAAALDGRSSELAGYLATSSSALSLRGVVLAGIVISALGVLADMGVTQASAVMALRSADPASSAMRLYRRGFRVGRDHLVATTHTLVLVYVGATLPLLLAMSASGVSATDALNSEELAEPILGTLVGAIALLISVPLTTALTAAVVARIPASALAGVHDHHH